MGAVIRNLALQKSAHRLRAAEAELLAADQHVVRELAVHREAQLPVGGERAVVVEAPAPDEVVARGALPEAVVARSAEVGPGAVVAAGEVFRETEDETGLLVLAAVETRIEHRDRMHHDIRNQLDRLAAGRTQA